MAKSKIVICPYCGEPQAAGDRCRACTGLFEPLSRQVTQNDMGPWYIRNVFRPFQPGCSYETLVRLIERGVVAKFSILRGPTTKQFWTVAKRVPGLSHLFGYCHNCDATVDAAAHGCHKCGVPFGAYLDRNHLGLAEVRPLSWEAPQVEAGPGGGRGTVGISSFASDAELTGGSSGGSGAAAMITTTDAEPTIVSTDEASRMGRLALPMGMTAVAANGTADDGASAATLQSIQRELAQQKRTTRNLLIGVCGVSAVALLLIFRMATMNRGTGGQAGDAVTKEQTQVPEGRGMDEAAAKDARGTSAKAADEQIESDKGGSGIAVASATKPVDSRPSVETRQADARAVIEEQRRRYEQAKDETRELEGRIAALQGVVDALKEVDAEDLTEADRGEKAQLEKDAGQLLAQLNLKKFFP